jgi:hypothetical protein
MKLLKFKKKFSVKGAGTVLPSPLVCILHPEIKPKTFYTYHKERNEGIKTEIMINNKWEDISDNQRLIKIVTFHKIAKTIDKLEKIINL